MTTTLENKSEILGQLWINFKSEDDWIDFFVYNDLGLPLAFAFSQGIIVHTAALEEYISETWDQLMQELGTEDTGFNSIHEIMDDN